MPIANPYQLKMSILSRFSDDQRTSQLCAFNGFGDVACVDIDRVCDNSWECSNVDDGSVKDVSPSGLSDCFKG